MHQQNPPSPAQKEQIKLDAERHIAELGQRAERRIEAYKDIIKQNTQTLVDIRQTEWEDLVEADAVNDLLAGKVGLFQERIDNLERVRNSPYFLRLDLTWADGKQETVHIGKHALLDEKIYSWLSPIATLRYSTLGDSEFETPDGESRKAHIALKDDFIIQSASIVFMAREQIDAERQMIFQKHFDERREFMLPEIVAELDRLQDKIIRTSPNGPFLISGPAGSGKTTLALHRIAYLVLTPEFKDYFDPERIMVFVADEGAVTYFSQLLPELGIHGVRISTFNDWATMIVNSRFRTKITQRFHYLSIEAVEEMISFNNPLPNLHPSLVFQEYLRLKQELIMPIKLKEGTAGAVYTTLGELYESATHGLDQELAAGFWRYWKFQLDNKYLDEVDLIILLNSLEQPIEPFVHVVVDEVQNWLPAQLKYISSITSRKYNAITFIGDIRQKTKPFTIKDWSELELDEVPGDERTVELLKVYRNTQPVLQHLQERGYNVITPQLARPGQPVEEKRVTSEQLVKEVRAIIEQTQGQAPGATIAILAKYREQLAGLGHLAFDSEVIHAMTISEAQGLEFHSVILLEPATLHEQELGYRQSVGYTSAEEFAAQDRHLYYVACTRGREQLYLVQSIN
jgi:DNA helicase IV